MVRNATLDRVRKLVVPDVCFAVCGPTTWDNAAVVDRVLKKLAGKYGVGRLLMVVGDECGLDKIAQTQARQQGIHVVVVPTLHSVYGRDAPRLAAIVKLNVLEGFGWGPELVNSKSPFVVPFFWSLKPGPGSDEDTRNMVILAKRREIKVVPVQKPKRVGMMEAAEWHHLQEKRRAKKRKKRR